MCRSILSLYIDRKWNGNCTQNDTAKNDTNDSLIFFFSSLNWVDIVMVDVRNMKKKTILTITSEPCNRKVHEAKAKLIASEIEIENITKYVSIENNKKYVYG